LCERSLRCTAVAVFHFQGPITGQSGCSHLTGRTSNQLISFPGTKQLPLESALFFLLSLDLWRGVGPPVRFSTSPCAFSRRMVLLGFPSVKLPKCSTEELARREHRRLPGQATFPKKFTIVRTLIFPSPSSRRKEEISSLFFFFFQSPSPRLPKSVLCWGAEKVTDGETHTRGVEDPGSPPTPPIPPAR